MYICYTPYATLVKYIILYDKEASILINVYVMQICIQVEHVIKFNKINFQLHVRIHLWFVQSARYLVLLPIYSMS